jgi:hypothetical protein
MNLNNKNVATCLLWTVFLLAFLMGPIRQLQGLALMPGDFGDARLNNYFLENIYQYLIGSSPSLIHLNFFSFFPYVLGFSDNLFGASPIYLFFRAVTGEPDTAFQIWFYFSYAANYFAAYWGLRLLGLSPLASICGSLIFAFALPVSAKTLHAQLGYRFCVPLVIAYFYLFLERGTVRLFLYSMVWLVWGFYCSIYIGAFTALFLVLMLITFLVMSFYDKRIYQTQYWQQWKNITRRVWLVYSLALVLMVATMGILMYPYIMASVLYGFKRHYSEIFSMLPSMHSYLLSDLSLIWGAHSALLHDIPIRHEQQLFIGVIPLFLLVASLFVKKSKLKIAYILILSSLLIATLITLKLGQQFSLWQYLSSLPLLSSLRAMGRIILVLLFPIAFLCAVAIQSLECRSGKLSKLFMSLVVIGLLVESVASNMYVAFPKSEWRARIASEELRLPKDIPSNAILFFSQRAQAPHIDELDAMWVSMLNSRPTLNGYSGNFPPGYEYNFGANCLELPRRVIAYLNFTQQLSGEKYSELMHRVVPIGFDNCQNDWLSVEPKITSSIKPYSDQEFKELSIQYLKSKQINGRLLITVDIKNNGVIPISGFSTSGHMISLSYRLLDKTGKPMGGWDPRYPLLADIPAKGTLKFQFDMPIITPDPGFVEFSLVQEGIFWGHDVGVTPNRVTWTDLRAQSPAN